MPVMYRQGAVYIGCTCLPSSPLQMYRSEYHGMVQHNTCSHVLSACTMEHWAWW
jgi:hypothetical protein